MKLSVNFFSHRHFWIGMYGVGVEAECSVCPRGVCVRGVVCESKGQSPSARNQERSMRDCERL